MAVSRTVCPLCGKLIIPPMGNPQSPILLVGESPGYHETIQGLPFAFRQKQNQTLSGDILKDELTRVGIMLNGVLVTNLWQHAKAIKIETSTTKTGKTKEKKVEACPMSHHLDELVRLMMIGRSHILLMGSEVTQALLGVNAGDVSGTRVQIPGVKANVWASPNPSIAFSQPIGELRLAFERFSEDVNKKKK